MRYVSITLSDVSVFVFFFFFAMDSKITEMIYREKTHAKLKKARQKQ